MTREELLAQFIADVKPALTTFFGRFNNPQNVLRRMSDASGYQTEINDGAGGTIPNPKSRADFIIENYVFANLENLYNAGERAHSISQRPAQIEFGDA